jgi:hypothetical protein
MIRMIAVALAFVTVMSASELDAIKAEPNLEKRSDKALKFAADQIDAATSAYAAGDVEKSKAALQDTLDAVELAYASLKETGKNPRRSPKHFKRAEVRTREMLRRMHSIETDFSVDDRGMIEKVEARVQQIHDELLASIFKKKQ